MSQALPRNERAEQQYSIRRYRPADREAFLALYESVWGRRRSEEWFEWRFEANPYGDGVSMVVAEKDDELVGAEPCLPFEVGTGRRRLSALQPADWIVHPEHRRRGVFSRMTSHLLERDAGGRFELYYNFPTDALLPGLDSFDWHVVGERPTYYRIERPVRLVEAKGGRKLHRDVAKLASPLSRFRLRLRDRLTSVPDDVTVVRYDEVPARLFTSLYHEGVPTKLHVARDEAFYDWRFENPAWETTAFVARRDGRAVAGVVACQEELKGATCTRIADVQPMDPDEDLTGAYAALVEAVVDDTTTDVYKVAGDVLPAQVLTGCGFWADSSFPLSKLGRRTVHAVRPTDTVDGERWRIRGRDPTDPRHWLLSLAGQDIA
ncbi:GNAT family N-acetyltransferase [Haloarchaeobius baliensis]|uniref:GNAT family N-acetyltransferase n=1 Tax=Haloarchaeobius baliensis TaxID=1670458 RepID=UPI003F8822AC